MRRAFTLVLSILVSASGLRADYDPMLTGKVQTEQTDLAIKDAKRSREIPIRVYLPTDKTAAQVVLFSHGLGGNREGSAFLGKHWAARGYVAVFLQHHSTQKRRGDSLLEGVEIRFRIVGAAIISQCEVVQFRAGVKRRHFTE